MAMPPYAQPGMPPPRKKTSPLVWILAILGVLFFLFIVVVGAGVWWVKHKVEQAGYDPSNPALTAVKIAAQMNPDIEIVSTEGAARIKIRQKSTGKIATVDLEQIKQGKIVWESDEEGGKSTVTLGAEPGRLPKWVPSYPGSQPKAAYSAESGDKVESALSFDTADSAADVVQFYTDRLEKAGMQVHKTESEGTVVLKGEDEGGSRTVTVAIHGADGKTEVQLAYAGIR